MSKSNSISWGIIAVSALGYFVDVYDLVLFSVLRQCSLQALGLPESEIMSSGVYLLNMQNTGLLLGGILWGVIGDKRGRIAVLFGSILLYSVANIMNAFVTSVDGYAFWRFIAGLGLAGELGAGITLVSESMPKEIRGYGTTIVATVGVTGAVVAALVGDLFDWRVAYIVGGVLGLGLLLMRVMVHESGLFKSCLQKSTRRGDLLLLFSRPERALRYLYCILIGLPCWFAVGILITFSPEIGAALKMPIVPKAGHAILYSFLGFIVGDLTSGLLSQFLKSRRKAIGIFIVLSTVANIIYLQAEQASLSYFYMLCVIVGFAGGYWAVLVSGASEQFGTNLRAVVTTTVPNFIRGAVVLMALSFNGLKSSWGVVNSAALVGATCCFLALIALFLLRESFGRDLDYIEE